MGILSGDPDNVSMKHQILSKQERAELRAQKLAALDATHVEMMRKRGVMVIESAVDQLENKIFALALEQYLRRPRPAPLPDAGNDPH